MRTATAVQLIAAALAELRPETDWAARAAAYNADLMAVHEEMVALFDTIPAAKRRIITNHDSLGYLEARYGFEVIGTVIPGATTLAETNPRAFARLIDLVVAEGVNVIFAENIDSTVLAEQLASQAVGRGDVAVRVVRLYTDALGQPGSGAETYLGMLRTTCSVMSPRPTASEASCSASTVESVFSAKITSTPSATTRSMRRANACGLVAAIVEAPGMTVPMTSKS